MKIRSYLVFCFLVAALLPTLIFSVWSYRDAVSREIEEVEDRHLLLARKAAATLERYHQDLVTSFETVHTQLAQGENPEDLAGLLYRLNMCCVQLTDKIAGRVDHSLDPSDIGKRIPPETLARLQSIARPDAAVFSGITALPDGKNGFLVVRELDRHYAFGLVSSEFFIDLGRSIVFGEKGHAAIVDRTGAVIAHPRADWISERKVIAKVTPVARMMKGETGIETFYSPAADEDMIAGFTTVAGPGWGVMVPQPVAEIYDKVAQNQSSLFLIVASALLATVLLGLILARSLSFPLEELARSMRASARNRRLSKVDPENGPIRFKEIVDFCNSYNRMVTRMTKAGEQIEKLAYSDHVTGLPNRDHLQTVAEPILTNATSKENGGIVVLIDLDNFKEINDLHGHHAGDLHLMACARVLSEVADKLHKSADLRHLGANAAPLVARIGGDEFIMLVQGLTSEPDIQAFLNDVQLAVSEPSPELSVTPSASIGCARFPLDGIDLEDLTKRADIAMYHAKRAGKNRVQLYTPDIGTQSAAETRRDLIEAIKKNQLYLEYQPKICTRRRVVISVEALVRWNHPEFGCLLPDHWLPLLNGSHAMTRLGEWVIQQAMTDHATLSAHGNDLWVAVNIGSNHFIASGFVETLEAIRADLGFHSRHLEIEVTEDALFTSEHRAFSTFASLKDLGYKVSIDDFGSGYSNITRLARLPVDFLKIDHSLIAGASKDPRIRTILASTIDMAGKLDCFTVAEGIETQNQADFATHLGADCLQGEFFTKSLPVNELIDWLDVQKGPAGHLYLRPESRAV